MVLKIGLLSVVNLGLAVSTQADTAPVVSLELGRDGSVNSQIYSCNNDSSLSVQYVNSGINSLAILPISGEERIFVNVISGSGVRYVSGQFTWWTKGKAAFLENAMKEDSNVNCVETASESSD